MTENFILEPLWNYFMNPTRKWPVYGQQDLIYDLRSCSINGLCLNAKLEEARRFGRCDFIIGFGWKSGRLFYRMPGLVLWIWKSQLSAVTVVFDTDFYTNKKMGPARLTMVDLSGRAHQLGSHSTLYDIKRCFGESEDSEKMDEHRIDYDFVVGKHFITSNHDIKSGRLLTLDITETADAEAQRQK
jgi:hypothetical protein